MRYLLHDADSLGYDLRDFEAVMTFAGTHPDTSFLIHTRDTNVPLFRNSLSGPSIEYTTYVKHDFARQRIDDLAHSHRIPATAVRAFADLYATASGRPRLSSGEFVPSGRPYLVADEPTVADCLERLTVIADRYRPLRVVFGVVSGVKPLSDVGDDPATNVDQGRRQTVPFGDLARTAATIQSALRPHGIAFVPLSAQYGDPARVTAEIDESNGTWRPPIPIQVVDWVDWNDSPSQQAACYRAVAQYSRDHGVPSVAFGNASTYLHLILAAAGRFDVMAVALHGHPAVHARDGREYWTNVAATVPFLATFRQTEPGEWQGVREALHDHVTDGVLSRL